MWSKEALKVSTAKTADDFSYEFMAEFQKRDPEPHVEFRKMDNGTIQCTTEQMLAHAEWNKRKEKALADFVRNNWQWK